MQHVLRPLDLILSDRKVVGLGSRATEAAQEGSLLLGNRGMADPDGGSAMENAYDIVCVQHFSDVAAVGFLANAQDIHE